MEHRTLVQVQVQSSKCMKFDFFAACFCMSTAITVQTTKLVGKAAALHCEKQRYQGLKSRPQAADISLASQYATLLRRKRDTLVPQLSLTAVAHKIRQPCCLASKLPNLLSPWQGLHQLFECHFFLKQTWNSALRRSVTQYIA